MDTTIELLDRAKKVTGCSTDYALAKRLGVHPNNISSYRRGRSHFDDAMAEKIAFLLDLEPGYVIACCQAERQKDAAGKARWARIAAILAVAALPPAAGAAEQGQLQIMSDSNVYYVKYVLKASSPSSDSSTLKVCSFLLRNP